MTRSSRTFLTATDDYNWHDDHTKNIEFAYAFIRERVAKGGKGWRGYPMNAWQSIETAPHDRRIILWTGREIYIGHWGKSVETDYEAFIIAEWGEGDQAMVGSATHWTEAPKPPATQRTGEG